MVPMRHSWIFRSRWIALLWAAGIIWFAVDFAAPDAAATDGAGNTAENAAITDVTGSPVANRDMAALKHFVDGN